MASQIPKHAKKAVTDGWAAETLYVCLLTNAFPNTLGAYGVYGDLTNELPTAGGYTVGGKEVTGRTSSYSTNDAVLDATADVQWTSATFANVRYAVVYNKTAPFQIRAIYDLGADKTVTGGTFTIQWSASGLIKIS